MQQLSGWGWGGGGGRKTPFVKGEAMYQCHHDVHIVPEFQGWSGYVGGALNEILHVYPCS